MTAALDHLRQVAQSGDLLLISGAGVSRESGVPSWEPLMRRLAADLGTALPSTSVLTSQHFFDLVAQYEDVLGRNALIRALVDAIRHAGKPNRFHEVVRDGSVSVIVTTNYDRLLEQSYRDANVPLSAVVTDSELAYTSERRDTLIKVAGDVDHPDSMCVTERDFDLLDRSRPAIMEFFASALVRYSVLTVGYSGRDPFFRRLLHIVDDTLGRHRRKGYMLTLPGSPPRVSQVDLESIEFPSVNALFAALQQIVL